MQKLTKGDLDQLVAELAGGSGGRKWTANFINPMLNLVSRVLSDLVRQGQLVRDVASLVDRMKRPLMHLQGVPIVTIAAWLGHADPAFTMRTYTHNQDDAMAAAAATLQRVVTPS